mmetsp:Transcript_22558/g.40627  ORF Transcript_22558/g.40627 Transcript_22558/m.40627 type:complete len:144 (+) Transcript_22558:372-803(+)
MYNAVGCLSSIYTSVCDLTYKKSIKAILLLMLRHDENTRPNFAQLVELMECGVFELPSYSLVNEAHLANEFKWAPPPKKVRKQRLSKFGNTAIVFEEVQSSRGESRLGGAGDEGERSQVKYSDVKLPTKLIVPPKRPQENEDD